MSIFDTPLDRRGSDSIKWGKYAGRDVLPLWVADMDFAAPPAVVDALQQRIAHGVFGYGHPWPSLTESVLAHLEGEYAWAIEPEWIVWLPGLVTGLNVACRAVDGEVLTATPIYPPFLSAPRYSGRILNRVDLACNDGRWQWDMAALAEATTAASGLFLLCHPHNPVGRCWNEDELRDLAAFAEENDLVVCSDEIHCGLILDADKRHIPFASLSPRRREAQHHADGAVENLQHPRPRLRLRGDSRCRAAPAFPARHGRHRAACECPRPRGLRSRLPRLRRLAPRS